MAPEFSSPGVYIEEISSGVRSIPAAPTSTTAFIGLARRGPGAEPTGIDSLSRFEKIFGRGSGLHTALHLFFANGGRQALVVRMRDRSLRGFLQALAALSGHPFNLLCLPEDAGPDHAAFAAQACETHRAFLLLDPPDGWTDAADAAAGLPGLGTASANAAVYFPRLSGRGAARIPPAPAVAGVIARTDAARGVWKAPAGKEATLHGAQGLSLDLTDAQAGTLNQVGINALRALPGIGDVVWGARTLAGNDNEWRYIPVRRTALFIEESIRGGTGWVVFEPNGEPLWAQLRAEIGAFLMGLFRAGAFQGAKPEEAFFVRCDATTMTADDIANRFVNVLVGFAPLKPAEFIIIAITLQSA